MENFTHFHTFNEDFFTFLVSHTGPPLPPTVMLQTAPKHFHVKIMQNEWMDVYGTLLPLWHT